MTTTKYTILDFTGRPFAKGFSLEGARAKAAYLANARFELVTVVPAGRDVYAVGDGEAFYPDPELVERHTRHAPPRRMPECADDCEMYA